MELPRYRERFFRMYQGSFRDIGEWNDVYIDCCFDGCVLEEELGVLADIPSCVCIQGFKGGISFDSCVLYVPAGCKNRYRYADPGGSLNALWSKRVCRKISLGTLFVIGSFLYKILLSVAG